MRVGSNVCYLFLLGWVDLDIFFLCVLANDQAIVDLHPWPDEESAKLFDFFEDIRSGNTLTHADDSSFIVPPKWSRVRLVLVENRLDHGSSLCFVHEFSPDTDECSR